MRLCPFIGTCVVVYFDDILVYSKDVSSHVDHLKTVLVKLREEKLFANAAKCSFFVPWVIFLGYEVSSEELKPILTKIAAIRDWPPQSSLFQVQSIHGLASFHQLFIKNFSSIMSLITDLMKRDDFQGTDEANEAFIHAKQLLIEARCLALLDFNKLFEVDCDASKTGIGSVLSQEKRPIAFYSEKLSGLTLNCGTYGNKLYVVVCALQFWRRYFLHKEFILYSDH